MRESCKIWASRSRECFISSPSIQQVMTASKNGVARKARVDGIELEYCVQGSGEPIVLIHGAIYADGLSLLRTDSGLARNYKVVSYSRRGFAGSTHPRESISIRDQAEDCRKLLEYLDVKKAHVVGSSYGGSIAMQLARDSPDCVHTLSLLEPMLPPLISNSSPGAAKFSEAMEQIERRYLEGNKAGAIDLFLTYVAGLHVRALGDKFRPGSFDQAVADIDTWFLIESPAMKSWSFTYDDAKKIKQPVIYVGGAESNFAKYSASINYLMSQWFPQSEVTWLPATTHAFTLTNLKGTTETLAGFFARHPLHILA